MASLTAIRVRSSRDNTVPSAKSCALSTFTTVVAIFLRRHSERSHTLSPRYPWQFVVVDCTAGQCVSFVHLLPDFFQLSKSKPTVSIAIYLQTAPDMTFSCLYPRVPVLYS